jgi:neopullulanase
VLRAVSPDGGTSLSLRGEWNGFNPQPMQRREDGTFEWKGTLEARDYGYGIGDSTLDPLAPYSRWVGQEEWSRLRVPDCTRPSVELTVLTATAQGKLTVGALVKRGSQGHAVTPHLFVDGAAVNASFDVESGTLSQVSEGVPAGRHTVRIEVEDTVGASAEPVVALAWVEATPWDWSQAVMYFVLVDRFRNGEPSNDAPVAGVPAKANFQGGDLQGLKAAIDEGYFDKLGVNTLWLSPLEPSPEEGFSGNDGRQYSGYHGYWPAASREVQRRFGGRAALDAVVQAAHARGIRLLADAVVNHVHEKHPRYVAHKNDGWFRGGCLCVNSACSFDVRPLDCWFAPYLPDYNWTNSAVADEVELDARFWIEEAGFDGFRVDAVKHFEKVGARTLAGAARQSGKPYLVGEVFAGTGQRDLVNQWLTPRILDGQFDFPLYWTIVDVFARGQPLIQLDAAVKLSESTYPSEARMSPFLGNHDVPRFLSIAAGQIESDAVAQAWSPTAPPDVVTDPAPFERLKQAFTFLLTAPGVPLIYYGDEIGLSGAGDPDNRRLMKWSGLSGNETGLRSFVQALGTARKKSRALQEGSRVTLMVETDLYVQHRLLNPDGALIVINRGSTSRTLNIAVGGERRRYKDVILGVEVELGNNTPSALTVPGGASMVLLTP